MLKYRTEFRLLAECPIFTQVRNATLSYSSISIRTCSVCSPTSGAFVGIGWSSLLSLLEAEVVQLLSHQLNKKVDDAGTEGR